MVQCDISEAEAALSTSRERSSVNPLWYTEQIRVGRDLGWSKERLLKVYAGASRSIGASNPGVADGAAPGADVGRFVPESGAVRIRTGSIDLEKG
jgi:hypothetical protein